jgi:hypothetical protein
MSEDNNQKEVHIVKEITRMDSKEYLSIKLRSPDESVDDLLKKALAAASDDVLSDDVKKAGSRKT